MKVYEIEVLYPGSFFTESSCHKVTQEHHTFVDAIALAIRLNTSRYVLAVRLITRTVDPLAADTQNFSPWLYLRGERREAADVLAGTSPDEDILRSNVRTNGYEAIVVIGALRLPLHKGDRVEQIL